MFFAPFGTTPFFPFVSSDRKLVPIEQTLARKQIAVSVTLLFASFIPIVLGQLRKAPLLPLSCCSL